MSFNLPVAESATDEQARVAEAALARAQAKLDWVDKVFSTWKPESPVSRFRRGEITLREAPRELAQVLALCRAVNEASDGWFDPWAMPGGVDPTGLVKGWAAERALDEFRAAALPAALVNAGGDVTAYGQAAPGEPWRVGVRHPLAADRLLVTVELDDAGAVATSGTYERGSHLVDPRSGAAAETLLSATVVGHDLGYADALATALYASNGEFLERLGLITGYHGFVVDAAGGIRASRGFPMVLDGLEALPA